MVWSFWGQLRQAESHLRPIVWGLGIVSNLPRPYRPDMITQNPTLMIEALLLFVIGSRERLRIQCSLCFN